MSPKNLFRNRFDHHTILGFIVLLLVILTNGLANADTLTWTNNGGSGFWHDDTNWNPERVPIDGDDVIIPVGTDSVTHSSGTTNLNSLLCSGNLTISNGILNFSSASSIDTGGTLNLSGGTLGGGGDITISGDFRWTGGTLTGSGTVTTSGVSTIGGFITLEGRKLINTGTATWSNIYFLFRNNAEIDNQSAITMDSDSGLNLGYSGQISGSFTNAGTVTISGGAGTAQFNIPLSNSGTVDIISGTLRLTTNTTNNGTIQGSGTLNVFGIEFTNAGNINPGTSSGILAINGNFQQSSTGALNTEFAGTDGSDYDQLNISGNLNLSGTLNLSLIEDFLPEDSNSFTIVIFSNLNGLFTQINWPALNPGLAWEYRTLASSIELYCGIDSDLDGLPDTLENTTCTMVNDADADADDLLDGQEDINKNGQKEPWETDPCDEDTDNDTMPDGWEVDHGLDPLDSSDCGQDPDDDLLTNCEEYFYSTDPNNADSDADGMPDGWEVDHNFDPLVDDALEDADQDGYSNLREYLSESDPRDHQDLPAVIADVDADNDCDGYDLAMFILEHGRDDCDTEPCDYDLDFDGDVDEIDLFLFSEDCGNIITPPNRAMKFWSAPGNEWGTYAVVGNIQKENEVISDFQNYHIKRVYGGYGDWITGTGNPAKNSTKKDQIAAWNLKLHNNGIESQVVFSRYSSIIPDSVDRQKLRASVLEVLNFNNSRSNPLEKFDGINLDLEPQALSGWDDGTADKKEYLNFLLDTYQDVRHHIMNNNGASQMPLYAQLGHHFDKMPEIGGKVNWSSEQARDDWFFAVKNTLSNITLMSYTLGSLDSIESTSQYERGIFENAEFCLNVKDIGTTWADLNEFMAMLNQIETNNHNLTGIHSFHHFKPYILQTNPPVADFIAITASGVSPLSVQFIDKSLNLPSSWAWDFDNDGTVESTDKNPLYVYSNPGIYTVKLTVTNEN